MAELSGASFVKDSFLLQYCSLPVAITYPGGEINFLETGKNFKMLEPTHDEKVVILQYLTSASGLPVRGQWLSFLDLRGGQLHWKLRKDPRVVVMEQINARYLTLQSIPEKPAFGVIDVSFISLTKVMPAVINVLADGAGLVTLIKPQFEAGREQVEKGGVVRDSVIRTSVVEKVKEFGEKKLGLQCIGVCESPLKGPAGNVEFLAYWKKHDQ